MLIKNRADGFSSVVIMTSKHEVLDLISKKFDPLPGNNSISPMQCP